MLSIDKNHAKRMLLLHHGFLGEYKFEDKQGVLEFVKQAGCVQYDPIDVCGKSSELTLQSRVKHFSKQMLYDLLYSDRLLLDYFDKNLAIIATEDFPRFRRTMESFTAMSKSKATVDALSVQIKKYIHEHEFACSKDFDFKESVDWYWNKSNLARAALETLYFRGELIIHHKKGALKYYTLAEDILPDEILTAKDPLETIEEYHDWAVHRRIRAVGFLPDRSSDALLAIRGFRQAQRVQAFKRLEAAGKIIRFTVEGLEQSFFMSSQDIETMDKASGSDFAVRTELIAPLDSFIWDRRLTEALFGFRYRWEIYNRPEDRKYGYYVLPLLHGENLIGRAELINQKKSKTLLVKNVWFEDQVKADKKTKTAINKCFERFALFNGCEKIDRMDK